MVVETLGIRLNFDVGVLNFGNRFEVVQRLLGRNSRNEEHLVQVPVGKEQVVRGHIHWRAAELRLQIFGVELPTGRWQVEFDIDSGLEVVDFHFWWKLVLHNVHGLDVLKLDVHEVGGL